MSHTQTVDLPAVAATSAPGPVFRIGLLWHSPNSSNLGVGALTIANMALAREAASALGLTPRFTMIAMRENGDSYVSGDDIDVLTVDTRALVSPGGAWSVIGAQDCLLDIGMGDSFADIYGFRRFLFIWATKMQGIAQKRPLLLSPQTIGPFTRPLYKAMARAALGGAAAVVARDDASLAAHQALAPAVRGVLSVDVAFALPYEDRSASRGGAKLRVGVNVSSLLYIEAENRTNRFGLDVDYADLMRRFLTDLTADPAVEVHLISHVAGDWVGQDNDGPVAQALAREFPGVVLVPAFKGPSEAKSYISSLDFLVAGRMHACIAAFSSGVPVIPVAYSRKFSGLFGMLGYKWLVPVKGVDTGAALKFLHDGLRDRALLAQDIRDGMMRVGALLDVYRDTLREFFAAARGGR